MASRSITSLAGFREDSRQIEFVRSLRDKTQEGKVVWTRKGNALTAAIPNGVTVSFVLETALFGQTPAWELFTVRDRAGSELMQIIPAGALDAPVVGGSLLEATNQLFASVTGIPGDELAQATDLLRKL